MSGEEGKRICPLCGSSDTGHFTNCRDHAVSGETYGLVKCNSCSVIFTIDTPDRENRDTYSKLEQELYRADKPGRFFDRVYYNMRFISIRRRVKLIENLTRLKSGRLLNYGAKSGFFSNSMENRGWNVTSLEEYHEHRVFSLEMFHHRMMELSEIDNLPVGSYDVITMWHTFEHEEEPGRLIDRMYSLLKPNGLLVIACPNTISYDAAHYGSDWAAWDVPRHLWHFNPQSIIKFCIKHRFILMYHKRIPLDVFYISMLSEKYKGTRFATLRGLAIATYFWLKTFGHRDGSSSIVYAFRKQTITGNGKTS